MSSELFPRRSAADNLARFEQGDAAFVTYRCAIDKGETFRNTEFFMFEGEQVKSIDVYFGASSGKLLMQNDQ